MMKGTQSALTEGKVHIPRSLHCLPDRNNERKSPTSAHSSPGGHRALCKGQLFNTHVH